MPQFDLPLDVLRTYRADVAEAAGFDDFWRRTLALDEPVTFQQAEFDNRQRQVDCYDLRFTGFGGAPIKAWLNVPAGACGPLPAVVRYRGYSGSRGMPLDNVFAVSGFAEFILDSRGQGWTGPNLFAGTPDPAPQAGTFGPPGPMTKGIVDPDDYYYRRLVTDAVRLLELAARHDLVDPGRIFVSGASQGGYLTLAAAGLAPSLGIELAGALPDVAFMCHIRRGVEIAVNGPYLDVAQFIKAAPHQEEAVWDTLAHFDGVSFARRATCPALFSVALADDVCPPSTVFAAFNEFGGPKDIEVYPFSNHEGGESVQTWRKLGWIAERVRPV